MKYTEEQLRMQMLAGIITEDQFKNGLNEEERDFDRDARAAGFSSKQYREYIKRASNNYKLDLTTKEGSPYTPIEIKAKTAKATLVKIRHNDTDKEKELWVPNFAIRNNEISTSFLDKNF